MRHPPESAPGLRRAADALEDSGIGDLTWVDRDYDPKARVILGALWVLGTAHHVWFIDVRDDVSGCQVAVRDPYNRFEDWADQRVQTIELPGLKGHWAMFVFPYGD